MGRRLVLKGLIAAPLATALACEEPDASGAGGARPDVGGTPDVADAHGQADAPAPPDGARHVPDLSDAGPDAPPDVPASPDSWATGGTRAMVDPDGYPDPFAAGGTTCLLTCATTLGPCHTASPERRDVSNAIDGLPVRLELRVVDEGCAPIEGAYVDIWHTDPTGGYSGDIVPMCNNAASAIAQDFFRGHQRSDADGRVAFHTCYPGWYPGRAIHIHFRVQLGAYVGASSAPAEIVSQLFFDEALTAEIFAEHPVYAPYGQPDTVLTTDSVVGGATDLSGHTCDVSRMPDGAMQASLTLVLRSESSSGCEL